MSDQIYMPLEKQEQMTIKKEVSANVEQDQELKNKTAYEDAMRYQEEQKQKELQIRQEEENISGERVTGTGNYTVEEVLEEVREDIIEEQQGVKQEEKETAKKAKEAYWRNVLDPELVEFLDRNQPDEATLQKYRKEEEERKRIRQEEEQKRKLEDEEKERQQKEAQQKQDEEQERIEKEYQDQLQALSDYMEKEFQVDHPFTVEGIRYQNEMEYVIKHIEEGMGIRIEELSGSEMLSLGIKEMVEDVRGAAAERESKIREEDKELQNYIKEELKKSDAVLVGGTRFNNPMEYLLEKLKLKYDRSFDEMSMEERLELGLEEQVQKLRERFDQVESRFDNEARIERNELLVRTKEELSEGEQEKLSDFYSFMEEELDRDNPFVVNGTEYANEAEYTMRKLEKEWGVEWEDLSDEQILSMSDKLRERVLKVKADFQEAETAFNYMEKRELDDAKAEREYQKEQEEEEKKLESMKQFIQEKRMEDHPFLVGGVEYKNELEYLANKIKEEHLELPGALLIGDDDLMTLDLDNLSIYQLQQLEKLNIEERYEKASLEVSTYIHFYQMEQDRIREGNTLTPEEEEEEANLMDLIKNDPLRQFEWDGEKYIGVADYVLSQLEKEGIVWENLTRRERLELNIPQEIQLMHSRLDRIDRDDMRLKADQEREEREKKEEQERWEQEQKRLEKQYQEEEAQRRARAEAYEKKRKEEYEKKLEERDKKLTELFRQYNQKQEERMLFLQMRENEKKALEYEKEIQKLNRLLAERSRQFHEKWDPILEKQEEERARKEDEERRRIELERERKEEEERLKGGYFLSDLLGDEEEEVQVEEPVLEEEKQEEEPVIAEKITFHKPKEDSLFTRSLKMLQEEIERRQKLAEESEKTKETQTESSENAFKKVAADSLLASTLNQLQDEIVQRVQTKEEKQEEKQEEQAEKQVEKQEEQEEKQVEQEEKQEEQEEKQEEQAEKQEEQEEKQEVQAEQEEKQEEQAEKQEEQEEKQEEKQAEVQEEQEEKLEEQEELPVLIQLDNEGEEDIEEIVEKEVPKILNRLESVNPISASQGQQDELELQEEEEEEQLVQKEKAEEEQLVQEEKAEEEQLVQEENVEEEQLVQEEKAEEEQLVQEKNVEEEQLVQEEKEEEQLVQEVEKKAENLFLEQAEQGVQEALERGKEGFEFDYLQNWKAQQALTEKFYSSQKLRIRNAGRQPFVEVPAREADTKGQRRREKRNRKRIRKYYADASIVTVREYQQLTDWFANQGHENLTASMDRMNMNQMRDDLLAVEITPEKMTERYISSHIVELYQYSRKCREFAQRLGNADVNYMQGQSPAMRTKIEQAILIRGLSFAKYLDEHMNVHGIGMAEDGQPLLKDLKEMNPNRKKELREYKERQNVYADILYESREVEEENLQKIVDEDFEVRMAKTAKEQEAKVSFEKLRSELTADLDELRKMYPDGYAEHTRELDYMRKRILLLMIAAASPVPEYIPSQEMNMFHQKMNDYVMDKSRRVRRARNAALDLAQEYRNAYKLLIGANVKPTLYTDKILSLTRNKVLDNLNGNDVA